jgi:hypothetical protein
MNEYTDSCTQLYKILREAWNEDGQQPSIEVWAKVLNLDPYKTADVHFKLVDLQILIRNTRNYIKSLETHKTEKYLEALDNIQSALLNNNLLQSLWGNVKSQISKETIYLIDACEDFLTLQGKTLREISPAELEELQQQIRTLLDEIINTDIDQETKQFLINELKKIEDAILNYRVRGSSGIVEVSEQSIGRIVVKWPHIPEPAREFAGKFITFLSENITKINAAMSVAEKLYHLPEVVKDFTKLLPPGNGN